MSCHAIEPSPHQESEVIIAVQPKYDPIENCPNQSCQIKPCKKRHERVNTAPVLSSPKWHDGLFLLGAAFAILCQFAPEVLAKGAHKHSQFTRDPLRRLRRTSAYMTAVVWGSESERQAVYSAVSRQHAPVKGANEPELHRWVASTLFVASVKVHETFYGPLPHWEREQLCQDCAVWATSLGQMPQNMWFDSAEKFDEYWGRSVDNFTITDEAKALANKLLFTSIMPWWMAWTMPFVRILTAGWLPPKFREAYGLPGPETFSGTWGLAIIVAFIKYTYCLLPKFIKIQTHNLLMTDMQVMVAEISTKGHWIR